MATSLYRCDHCQRRIPGSLVATFRPRYARAGLQLCPACLVAAEAGHLDPRVIPMYPSREEELEAQEARHQADQARRDAARAANPIARLFRTPNHPRNLPQP